MKRSVRVLTKNPIFVGLLSLALACDEESPLTLDQKVARALTVVENNERILDDVMVDGNLITSPTEYHIRTKQVQDRDQFVAKMIEDTERIYAAAALNADPSYRVTTDRAPVAVLRSYLKLFPTGYSGTNGLSVIDMLKQETLNQLNRHAGHEKQILLNDWSFSSSGTSTRSDESLSLNFENIKIKHIELENALISTYAISGNPGTEIIEKLELTTPEEKMFVGLLLSSVTITRSTRSAYENLINDTFDFTAEQRKQFDHDIRLIAYEIAIQYIISEEYHNQNEHEASLEINRRVFNAMMAVVAAIGYDKYK